MEQEKIATETMSKVEGLSSPNKNNEEEMTMAERKPVNNEEPVNEEEKKPAKKSSQKKEEKVGLGTRIKNWWKRNWGYVAAASGGVVAGAAATYGAGKVGEHIAQKRNHREDEE